MENDRCELEDVGESHEKGGREWRYRTDMASEAFCKAESRL